MLLFLYGSPGWVYTVKIRPRVTIVEAKETKDAAMDRTIELPVRVGVIMPSCLRHALDRLGVGTLELRSRSSVVVRHLVYFQQ